MQYSAISFDAARLPACLAAIEATFPTIKTEVRRDLAFKTGREALTLLREKWDPNRSTEFRLLFPEATVSITLVEVWDLFRVQIEGGSEEVRKILQDLVRDTLGLSAPTQQELESVASLYAINQRILKLHEMVLELPDQLRAVTSVPKLRCFVSFRFDDHSKALALELREFMQLAGLEFISGLGYEPRSVSEKVLDRLSGKIDLFLVIFTVGDDSAWLHQEIGVAKGRGLPIVVLREADTSFDEGLLSDIEYASFPANHISGAFIPVLQAVQYVRLNIGEQHALA